MSQQEIAAVNPRYVLKPEDVALLRSVFIDALDSGRQRTEEEKSREANFALRLATKGAIELSHKQLYLLCQMILSRAPDADLPPFVHHLFHQTSISRAKLLQTLDA